VHELLLEVRYMYISTLVQCTHAKFSPIFMSGNIFWQFQQQPLHTRVKWLQIIHYFHMLQLH